MPKAYARVGSTRNTWARPPLVVEGAVGDVEVPLGAVLVLPRRGQRGERGVVGDAASPCPRRRRRVPACSVLAPVLISDGRVGGDVAGLLLVGAGAEVQRPVVRRRRSAASCAGRRPGGPSSASTARRRSGACSTSAHGVARDALVAVAGVELGGRGSALMGGDDGGAPCGLIGRCETDAMPGVALVLGAGGTVGHAFHAGVLTALGAELAAGTPAAPTSSSARRPARSSRALLRAGHAADRPGPAGQQAAAVARRCGRRAPGRARPAPAAPAAPAAVGVDGVAGPPARRAARAPWAVTPGSLAAAVLPGRAGRRPRDMAVPFDNLYGGALADGADVDRRRAARHRPAHRVRPAGRARGARSARRCGRRAPSRRTSSRPRSTASATSTAACTRRRTPTSSAGERPDLVLVSAPMSAVRGAVRRRPDDRDAPDRPACRWPGRSPACAAGASPSSRSSRRRADLEVMAGDSLDPAKFAPGRGRGRGDDAPARWPAPTSRERLAALG